MADREQNERCPLCNRGRLLKRTEAIAFHQSTDKGYIFCRLNVATEVCDNCGNRVWDEETEALIEEAVKREYDKLP
jgi:hypothetical protein